MSLVLAILFLAFSAFIAGTETAFFHLTPKERAELATQEDEKSQRITRLLAHPRKLLLTLLICNEASNLAFATAFAFVLYAELGMPGLWLNFILAVLAILIFAETIPKSLAIRRPIAFAKRASKPLAALHLMLTPVRWALMQVATKLLALGGASPWGLPQQIEEEDLKHLVDLGEQDGTIDTNEWEWIHNVFEFGDLMVQRLMTARTEMVAFSMETAWEDILEGLKESRLARVPIYDESPDSIIGILYTKDLLSFRLKGIEQSKGATLHRDMLRPAKFVPETMKADVLFKELQESNVHMAIVLDEYGGVSGLITMDDLLGELFGEMLDEGDSETPPAVKALANGLFDVLGSAEIEELNDHLGVNIPQSDEYSTVAGYLLSHLGCLPQAGATHESDGLRFVVSEVADSRLLRLKVSLIGGIAQ